MKKIKFVIDPEQDIAIFLEFAKDAEKGTLRYLEKGILAEYPECKKWFIDNQFTGDYSDVEMFVKSVYKKSEKEFNINLKERESLWRSVENTFYALTNEIFGSTKWPDGKYIMYATIWSSYPYSPFDMTSHFPIMTFEKDYTNVVIAHEMLHFIFFAHFPNLAPKNENDFDSVNWHIAEIFNAVVQDSDKWRNVFQVAPTPYKEHVPYLTKLKKKYRMVNKNNLDELITDIRVEINKKKPDCMQSGL